MRKPSTVALLLVLTLSACSGNEDTKGSEDDGSATPTSSEAPSTPASSAAPDAAADQAIVEAAVLTIKDMPAGWTAAAPEDDEDDEEGKAEMAECLGISYDELYNDAHASADSDDFTSPDDSEVSMSVGLATSEEWMTHAFEIASSPKFRECSLTAMEDELSSDDEIEVGEVTLDEMSFDQIGDEVAAFRMTLPMSTQGVELEAIVDFVVVRVGRGQALLSALSLGSPMSAEELAGFAQISVDRLQAALAES